MQERLFVMNWIFENALGENKVFYAEFPFPVRLEAIKAWSSNDSDATLTVADPAVTMVTATTVGDSGDPKTISPDGDEEAQVAKDTLITFTVDYDGDGGTGAQDLEVIAFFKSGEG